MKVVRFVSRYSVLALLALGGALIAPRFLAAGLTNAAQVLFSREVMARAQAHPEWTADLFPELTVNTGLEPAHSMLQTALRFDPDSPLARWVLYVETLTAHSQAGDHAGVIQMHESGPAPGFSRINRRVNNIIALAYLERAKNWLATDRYTLARADLETSLTLRPGDLYALYHLLEIDTFAGNVQMASAWRDRLVHFSETGLYFPDERLADFAADAIYRLLSQGLWERSVALNSAALLTWRESGSPGTERLLRRFAAYYPTEPEWYYLLGEVFQRQGRWADAYAEYRHALAADPTYDPAWLRLGITCEALIQVQQSGCTPLMAREFYMAYTSVHPDDVVALTKLLGIERKLGMRTVEREAKLNSLADERLLLAEQFNLAPEAIALGPNLITNPGFEVLSGSRPAGWHGSSHANNPPFDRALFRAGLDSLDSAQGNQSARVSGLWVGDQPERASPSEGFWAWNESQQSLRPIPLERDAIYVLSFNYRTAWMGVRGVTVYLNTRIPAGGSFGGEHAFPPTEGAWRQALLLGWTGDDSSGVLPLLRLWGPGQVLFDNVELREVIVPSQTLSRFISTSATVVIR